MQWEAVIFTNIQSHSGRGSSKLKQQVIPPPPILSSSSPHIFITFSNILLLYTLHAGHHMLLISDCPIATLLACFLLPCLSCSILQSLQPVLILNTTLAYFLFLLLNFSSILLFSNPSCQPSSISFGYC